MAVLRALVLLGLGIWLTGLSRVLRVRVLLLLLAAHSTRKLVLHVGCVLWIVPIGLLVVVVHVALMLSWVHIVIVLL